MDNFLHKFLHDQGITEQNDSLIVEKRIIFPLTRKLFPERKIILTHPDAFFISNRFTNEAKNVLRKAGYRFIQFFKYHEQKDLRLRNLFIYKQPLMKSDSPIIVDDLKFDPEEFRKVDSIYGPLEKLSIIQAKQQRKELYKPIESQFIEGVREIVYSYLTGGSEVLIKTIRSPNELTYQFEGSDINCYISKIFPFKGAIYAVISDARTIYVFNETGFIRRWYTVGDPKTKNKLLLEEDVGSVEDVPGEHNDETYSLTISPITEEIYFPVNNRIRVFTLEGKFVRKWNVGGNQIFNLTIDLRDGKEEIYTVQYGILRVFTPTGQFLREWVIDRAGNIAISPDHEVYLTTSSKVSVFSPKGQLIREYLLLMVFCRRFRSLKIIP